MPNYPPIDGLQQAVDQKILPKKAGNLSPVVMRAAESLRKLYPADMYSADIKELPVTHPHAFSSILGETPVDLSPLGFHQNPEEIQLNPAMGMGFAQAEVAHNLSHELEHVRQGRTLDPLDRLSQFKLPYDQRPDEIGARHQADADALKLPLAPKGGPSLRDNTTIVNGLGGLFLRTK